MSVLANTISINQHTPADQPRSPDIRGVRSTDKQVRKEKIVLAVVGNSRMKTVFPDKTP